MSIRVKYREQVQAIKVRRSFIKELKSYNTPYMWQ